MNNKFWIKGAIKHKGALIAKAKKAGLSISQYCAKSRLDLQTKKQCTLAKILKKFN